MRLNSTIRFHFAWTKVNKMKARGILFSKSPCLPGATSDGSWQARLAPGKLECLAKRKLALPVRSHLLLRASLAYVSIVTMTRKMTARASTIALQNQAVIVWRIDSLKFAEVLRAEIFAATNCNASVGLGPSLLLARLATRKAKPNGTFFLSKEDSQEFMKTVSVQDLPGISFEKYRHLFSCCKNAQTFRRTRWKLIWVFIKLLWY
jgi:hypothetical protein